MLIVHALPHVKFIDFHSLVSKLLVVALANAEMAGHDPSCAHQERSHNPCTKVN